MKQVKIKSNTYKLPDGLTDFQTSLYIHLINWKWQHITNAPGIYQKKDKNGIIHTYEYDAILPTVVHNKFPIIFPSVLNDLKEHKQKYNFKFHEHFNHMASSQAANVNLFLPVLLHSMANQMLNLLKKDFKELAINELYKGFRIEFWDGNSNTDKGILGDHSAIAGTDSDIAIAYYNKDNELCLWLIEHKLTEKEFTECGGAKSKGRKQNHDCTKSFSEILKNKDLCYYHSSSKYQYWNITEANQSIFVNHSNYKSCPFQGGMNQLWRNQLLGFAIEKLGKYKHVYFSVVHHPDNDALGNSIHKYKDLINANPKFSVFTSKDVIDIASKASDSALQTWVDWYKELYKL
jgi:hypothetical protein